MNLAVLLLLQLLHMFFTTSALLNIRIVASHAIIARTIADLVLPNLIRRRSLLLLNDLNLLLACLLHTLAVSLGQWLAAKFARSPEVAEN